MRTAAFCTGWSRSRSPTRPTTSASWRSSRRSTTSGGSVSRAASSTSPRMPSPGDVDGPVLAATPGPRSAADLLQEARARERGGHIPEAIVDYETAIDTAEGTGEPAVLAEALRRLGLLSPQRGETVHG